MARRLWALQVLSIIVPLLLTAVGCSPGTAPLLTEVSSDASAAAIREAYGRLPLHFEENRGQAEPGVRYLSRGRGYAMFLTPGGVTLRLGAESVRMTMIGARHDAVLTAADELPGKVNYLVGGDPGRWRTGVPTYAKVRYAGLYPGIDAVLYGNQRQLEYDFVVAPGADPSRIRVRIDGTAPLALDADGDLRLTMAGGTLIQHKPVIYQVVEGARVPVEGGYVMLGARDVGFRVGAYDRSRALVIDPVVSYATYLGGSLLDEGEAVAVDAAGNAYVTGTTSSANFPVTAGVQAVKSGTLDAFVVKLNASGTSLIYATYLGGNLEDEGMAIAVDAAGNAYVTGVTLSTDFPTVAPAQPANGGGNGDAFIAKLNPSGTALVYSTYLGGSGADEARGIAVDATGAAYVAGSTSSTMFPTTAGAFQTTHVGASAYVAKLTAAGALAWSTYLGNGSTGSGIAIDSGGVYVVGTTSSSSFPTTPGAFQTTDPTDPDESPLTPFVTKLNLNGTGLVYSTYLGGSAADWGLAIAVWDGHAHITGQTNSPDFPTVNAFQTSNADGNAGGDNAASDAFVAKLNKAGTSLVFSTYLGGAGADGGFGIAVDGAGGVYVAGLTSAVGFPSKEALAPFDPEMINYFVTKLTATGALAYSTPIATGMYNSGNLIAVDAAGNAYVAGRGAPLSTTPGAFQTMPSGNEDAFVVKLAPGSGGGGGGADTTSPVVSITKPSNGAWTGNSIQISATATDNVGLKSIEIWGNGAVLGTITCTGTPCTGTIGWITGSLPPAAYEVQAVALDTSDNRTVSAPITINKSATSPKIPSGAQGAGAPSTLHASFDHPATGAQICGGSIPVGMIVSGGTGQRTGTLRINGVTQAVMSAGIAPDKHEPAFAWDASTAANGPHTLTFSVSDQGGATATASMTINIGKPLAAIASPASGATVSGVVPVTITTTDFCETHDYFLGVDASAVGSVAGSAAKSATINWDSTKVPNGSHTLFASVTVGTMKSTKTVTVTVNNGGAGGGDTGKPTIAITSPVTGAWTGNSIGIAVGAADDAGLVSIKVWANGGVIATIPCTGKTCGKTVTWLTGSLPPAAYEVNAVALDTAGNQTVSPTVTIFKGAKSPVKLSGVSGTGGGGGGTPPPLTATIVSPAHGATISGDVTVTIEAGNSSGNPLFILKVDNTNVLLSGNTGGSKFSTLWSTQFYSNGTHTLDLSVTDGTRTATATTTVTVLNPSGGPDATPPSVSITSPSNGAWTGNSIGIIVTGTDNIGLSNIQIYTNGQLLENVPCASTSCTGAVRWMTGTLPRGKHTITAVATDKAGNKTTSAPIVINR